MKTVGIICEYNPFHLGHKKQFDIIRQTFGPETAIVGRGLRVYSHKMTNSATPSSANWYSCDG